MMSRSPPWNRWTVPQATASSTRPAASSARRNRAAWGAAWQRLQQAGIAPPTVRATAGHVVAAPLQHQSAGPDAGGDLRGEEFTHQPGLLSQVLLVAAADDQAGTDDFRAPVGDLVDSPVVRRSDEDGLAGRGGGGHQCAHQLALAGAGRPLGHRQPVVHRRSDHPFLVLVQQVRRDDHDVLPCTVGPGGSLDPGRPLGSGRLLGTRSGSGGEDAECGVRDSPRVGGQFGAEVCQQPIRTDHDTLRIPGGPTRS